MGNAAPTVVKQAEITGSSTAVKEKTVAATSVAAATASELVMQPVLAADLIESLGHVSEGENSEEESVDASQTLGEVLIQCFDFDDNKILYL